MWTYYMGYPLCWFMDIHKYSWTFVDISAPPIRSIGLWQYILKKKVRPTKEWRMMSLLPTSDWWQIRKLQKVTTSYLSSDSHTEIFYLFISVTSEHDWGKLFQMRHQLSRRRCLEVQAIHSHMYNVIWNLWRWHDDDAVESVFLTCCGALCGEWHSMTSACPKRPTLTNVVYWEILQNYLILSKFLQF